MKVQMSDKRTSGYRKTNIYIYIWCTIFHEYSHVFFNFFSRLCYYSFDYACDLFAHIHQDCCTVVCENLMADPMAMKLQYGWCAYMMIYEMEYSYVSIEGWIGCFGARQVLVTDCYLTDTKYHYNDVVKSAKESQITGLSIVCNDVCSGTDHRKHQSSALLVFVRGIHRSPGESSHKRPVTRKMFPFDGIVMAFTR